uniref:Uncharacterized protein n=1 Tax=Brassica oleracea var. oleracea TaxID=109376 RepID=A0A0D3BJG2_BRAOL
MTPGLLVRIHRINDSVEVLENSNMTFPFKGPWFAGKDVLITVDPANIQHIVTSNFSNYIKGAEFQEIFEVCGDGIINSDADRASKLKKCYQALLRHQGFQRDSMSITTRKLNDVFVSTNEPKTEALLNVKTQAQPKTQHNKMGLKLNDKQSYCNGQATQSSCHSTINTAQQIQLANRFDSLVC